MQTRAELFGPYIAAAKLKTYEIFVVLGALDTLPVDLVREIGGRILALNILAAESEFNADMGAKFIAALNTLNIMSGYKFLNIGTCNPDMAEIITKGAPYCIMATGFPGGYKNIYVLRSMIEKHGITDILQIAAANFKLIDMRQNCLVIEL